MGRTYKDNRAYRAEKAQKHSTKGRKNNRINFHMGEAPWDEDNAPDDLDLYEEEDQEEEHPEVPDVSEKE